MGLKGSLRDFGISEILQLIGGQRRTGRLEVSTKEAQFELFINAGKIVQVLKKPELKSESLLEYLGLGKAVPLSQLNFALQKAKNELKPLEAVLVGLGFISASDLKRFILIRNLDLLTQLFLLKDGEYEFSAEPINYHPAYVAEIDTEQVLMEGYRIKDEWNPILKEIGSMNTIFQKVAGEYGPSERLSEEQAKVYELVNGKRSIAEIAVLVQMTKFDTIKTLAELKQVGRIEAVRQVPEKGLDKESRGWVSRFGFWFLLGLGLVLVANGVRIYLTAGLRGGIKLNSVQSWQEERIRQGLEIFRLEQGSYPAQLSELKGEGLLTAGDLKFAENLSYSSQEGGYQLRGPGP